MQESTWGGGIRGWLVKLVGLVGAAVCAYCGIGCLERWHVRDHETQARTIWNARLSYHPTQYRRSRRQAGVARRAGVLPAPPSYNVW